MQRPIASRDGAAFIALAGHEDLSLTRERQCGALTGGQQTSPLLAQLRGGTVDQVDLGLPHAFNLSLRFCGHRRELKLELTVDIYGQGID